MNENIFIKDNPYGYRLNINHTEINNLYRRYKKYKGLAPNIPITHEQRLEFELYILNTNAFKKLLGE